MCLDLRSPSEEDRDLAASSPSGRGARMALLPFRFGAWAFAPLTNHLINGTKQNREIGWREGRVWACPVDIHNKCTCFRARFSIFQVLLEYLKSVKLVLPEIVAKKENEHVYATVVYDCSAITLFPTSRKAIDNLSLLFFHEVINLIC